MIFQAVSVSRHYFGRIIFRNFVFSLWNIRPQSGMLPKWANEIVCLPKPRSDRRWRSDISEKPAAFCHSGSVKRFADRRPTNAQLWIAGEIPVLMLTWRRVVIVYASTSDARNSLSWPFCRVWHFFRILEQTNQKKATVSNLPKISIKFRYSN